MNTTENKKNTFTSARITYGSYQALKKGVVKKSYELCLNDDIIIF